jgi:hypothetical protein
MEATTWSAPPMAGLACKAPSTDLLDRVVVTVELIADCCTTYRGLTSEIPADKACSFSEGCRALGDVSRTCGIGGATKPGCRFAHPGCASFVFDLQMCNRHDLKSCGATLFAAVWLRERAHVRKNAA